MDVARPVQVEGVFAVLDFDSVFCRRISARGPEVEGVGWAVYSFDIKKVLSFLIQCIEMIPEKVGIGLGGKLTGIGEGAVTEGDGTTVGGGDKTRVPEHTPAKNLIKN